MVLAFIVSNFFPENFQDSKEIMMTSDTKAEYKYSTVERSTSTTGNPGTCAEGELRCINGHCITLSQLCDRVCFYFIPT